MNVSIGGIAKTVEITSFDKLGDVKVCMLTTTADGSVGFEQLNDEVRDTIYASFPVDNAKGDIASFEDGSDNVPVRELKLNIEPYQNLNGYANPWVGGAGVNMAHLADGTRPSNNVTTTVSAEKINSSGTSSGTWIDLTWQQDIEITSGQTYTVMLSKSISYGLVFRFATDSGDTTFQQVTIGAGNTSVTFTANNNYYKMRLWLTNITNGQSISITDLQVLVGSGTVATWSPYENICPIAPATGANQWDEEVAHGYYNAIGEWTSSDSIVASKYPIPVIAGETYHCYVEGIAPVYVTFWDSDAPTAGTTDTTHIVGTRANYANLDFTIPSGASYIHFNAGAAYGATYNHNISFNYPSAFKGYYRYNAIGITRIGKNFWSLASGGTATTNFIIPFTLLSVPKGTYTFSFKASIQTAIQPTFRDQAGANVWTQVIYPTSLVNGYYRNTITFDRPVTSASIYSNGTSTLSEIQLEVGSTATEYEPYAGDRYFIDSSTPIYGGTLEVETGVLTVTHRFVDLGSLTWTKSSPRFYTMFATSAVNCPKAPSSDTSYIANAICSQYSVTSRYNIENVDGSFSIHNAGVTTYITIHDNSLTSGDATAFKTAMNGVQLVYELATPQTYQLTPTQVKTLLGYNNIWTDSGTVEVQYRANIGLYIQKIIGSSEDDMIANQNIAANQYFFVGEELYYSTSAISAGQTIVVGTNCIKTTLADALNALNS